MHSGDDDPARAREAALALAEQGRPAAALPVLERLLADRAADMPVQNARGQALLALGRPREALAAFARARELEPDAMAPALNIAVTLGALGRWEEALASYPPLRARWPNLAIVHRFHADALAKTGRPAEALAMLRAHLIRWPDDADALIDRGNLQMDAGQFEAARSSHAQAAAMLPANAVVHYNLGNALQALDRHQDALAAYDGSLRLDPGSAPTLINRANTLRRLNRHPEALEDYRRVLALQPDNALAMANLGKTLGEIGQREPALAALDRAIAMAPGIAEARWMRATTTIPLIRQSGENLPALRAEFAAALADYDAWAVAAGDLPAVVNVGRPHPFFLAYQAANNRDLMAAYGTSCARVMRTWFARSRLSAPSPARAAAGRALRVGIVSAHVVSHSVWLAIMRGWLQFADPARVAYHVFYLGAARDQQTDLAEGLAARFTQGVRSIADWVAEIGAADLDALVYPEIGMDDMTVKLASLRLAPVQVAAWGHPETTGLPTIDHFVSAAALEPPGAQAHYCENLVTLPRLGCCYTPLPMPGEPPDLAALGLRADAPIAICPGVPFKYTPEQDQVYVAIARRAPACQLVFFRQDVNPLLSDAVFARLTAAFAAAGLDIAAHARLIPWQNHARFYGLMRRADLFLDTIGFSGFNTAIQAIECGLPIVTMEGEFMRGRLASGILREMGMGDLVAADAAGYVDTAARLLNEPAQRQAARARIVARRDRIFGDVGTVRAFEAFLRDAHDRAADAG